MKILKEQTKLNFKTGYMIKEVTAIVHVSNSEMVFSPVIRVFNAVYKNGKIFGIIKDKSELELQNSNLFKLELVNRKQKYAVFNRSTGLVVYEGNNEISINKNGFTTESDVILKKYHDCNGKEKNSKIFNHRLITIGEVLDSIDD